jgi:hypothetical protein
MIVSDHLITAAQLASQTAAVAGISTEQSGAHPESVQV